MEKAIVVTGAAGGIGLALVEYFLRNGKKNIVCQYRSNENALRDLFERYDVSFEKCAIKADLLDELQISNIRKKANESFSGVWGVVNLAGTSSNGMSWKLSREDFSKIIDNNLVTTFLVSKEFIPQLREQNGGRIINISSVAAFQGAPGASHYGAAKAAIVGLTKSMALELASKCVTVNAVALGYFQYGLINHLSPQLQEDVKSRTPLKKFGNSDEVGGIVDFLLSDKSSFTTGQVMHVNGGIYL